MTTNDRSEEGNAIEPTAPAPAGDATTPSLEADTAGTTVWADTQSPARVPASDVAEGPLEATSPVARVAAPVAEPGVEAPPATPAYRRGPYAGTVLLGLLCLAVAWFAFADRAFGLSVDWGRWGPLGILIGGAVLVLLGLLGMRSKRG